MAFGLGGSGGNEMEVKVSADTTNFQNNIQGAMQTVTGFKEEIAGIGLAMSAASVGVMSKAVGAAREMASAQREISKVTDPETAEQMTAAIGEMGKTIPLATSELGNIAAEAGRFGIEGTDAMTAFTETVAKMAAATTLNTETAGQAFAKMGSLMDVPTHEAENLGSAINALSNSMATSSDEIVKSTLKSSAALSSMGASQQEIVALNAAMNEVSTSASVAGTGLRRVAQEMVDPRKAEALATALGMDVDQFRAMVKSDPTDVMLKMAEGMNEGGDAADILNSNLSTFSRQTLSGLGSNLDATREALAQSNEEYAKATSLQKEFEVETGSLGGQLQILRNQIDGVLVTIGNQFTPHIKNMVSSLQDAVASFEEWNNKTDGAAAAALLVGTAIAGIVPALGLLISAIMPAIGAFGTLVGSFGAVTAASGGVLGTIGSIVAALGTMVAPVALVVGAVLGLAKAWQVNFGNIREHTASVVSAVTSEFEKIRAASGQLVSAFTTMFAPILSLFPEVEAAATAFGTTLESVFGRVVAALSGRLVGAVERAGQGIRTAMATAATFMETTGAGMVATAVSTGQQIATAFRQRLGQLGQIVSTALGKINAKWATHGDKVMQVVSTLTDHLFSLRGVIMTVGAIITGSLLGPLGTVATVATSVGTTLGGLGVKTALVGTKFKNLLPPLNSVKGGFGKLRAIVLTVASTLRSTLGGAIGFLRGLLPTIIGFVSSFSISLSGLGTALVSAAGYLRMAAAAVLGLTGPIGIAISLVAALYMAWKNNLGGIRDTTMEVFSAVKALIRGDTTEMKGIIQRALAAIKSIWETQLKPLIASAKQIFNQIKTAIGNALRFINDNLVQPMLQRLKFLWATHAEEIYQEVLETFDAIKGYIQTVLNAIMPIITTFLEQASAFWAEWGDEIMTVVEFVFDIIVGIIQTALDVILTVITVIMNLVQLQWGEAWNAIAGLLERTLGGIINFAKSWGGRFLAWVGSLVDGVIQWFKDLARELIGGSIIPDMFAAIISAVETFVSDFVSAIVQFVSDVIAEAESLYTQFTDKIDSLVSEAETAINSFIATISNNVTNFVNNLITKAENLYNDFTSEVTDLKDDVISDFETLATDVVDEVSTMLSDIITDIKNWDIVQKFKDKLDDAKQKFIDFSKDIIGNSIIPDMTSAVDSHVSGWDLGSSFEPPLNDAESEVQESMGAIKGYVDSGLTHVTNTANDIVNKARSAAQQAKSLMRGAINSANRAHRAEQKANRSRGRAGSGDPDNNVKASDEGTSLRDQMEADGVKFAHGGIVTEPTKAVIGEAGDSEAVIPLNNQGARFLQDALGGGAGGPMVGELTIYANDRAGGRAAARGFADALRSENFD